MKFFKVVKAIFSMKENKYNRVSASFGDLPDNYVLEYNMNETTVPLLTDSAGIFAFANQKYAEDFIHVNYREEGMQILEGEGTLSSNQNPAVYLTGNLKEHTKCLRHGNISGTVFLTEFTPKVAFKYDTETMNYTKCSTN
jgi:hypothetical protein